MKYLVVGENGADLNSEGGVEVGDVDAKALKLLIPVGSQVSWVSATYTCDLS